jgi:DnaJ-class molecular chaperone
MATVKKAVKKVAAKVVKKKKPVEKEVLETCPMCDGRGLKDANTLCTPCSGSGKI